MEGRGGSVRPSAADRLPGPGAGATPPPGCFFVGRSGRAMRTTLIVLGALLLGGALFGPGRAAAREPEPAPQKAPSAEEIQQLVRQLGDDSFSVRELADDELRAVGPPAVPALRQALRSPDPEVRR